MLEKQTLPSVHWSLYDLGELEGKRSTTALCENEEPKSIYKPVPIVNNFVYEAYISLTLSQRIVKLEGVMHKVFRQ